MNAMERADGSFFCCCFVSPLDRCQIFLSSILRFFYPLNCRLLVVVVGSGNSGIVFDPDEKGMAMKGGRKNDSADAEAFRCTFDHIFTEAHNQEYVFKYTAAPIVKDVMTGYNCTIFACKCSFSSPQSFCALYIHAVLTIAGHVLAPFFSRPSCSLSCLCPRLFCLLYVSQMVKRVVERPTR